MALDVFLAKVAGSLVGWLIKPLLDKWRGDRPLGLKRFEAPTNLFDELGPASSKEHVEACLGPPHQVIEEHWFYRCTNGLVQIKFFKDGGAKFVAIGLTGHSNATQFTIPHFDKPLGRLSVEDVMGEGYTIEYNSSLRHEEVIVRNRFGPTGAWTNLTFGAMYPLDPRMLVESPFEWDAEKGRLKTPPSFVLINWAAVGHDAWFDWSMCG